MAQEVPTLWLDEQLVCQILGNLLSNAIKYCPKAVPQLDVRLKTIGAHVRFVVDQGWACGTRHAPPVRDLFRASNVGTSRYRPGAEHRQSAVDLHGGSIDQPAGPGHLLHRHPALRRA
jgi:signal transduction histidine kinase